MDLFFYKKLTDGPLILDQERGTTYFQIHTSAINTGNSAKKLSTFFRAETHAGWQVFHLSL